MKTPLKTFRDLFRIHDGEHWIDPLVEGHSFRTGFPNSTRWWMSITDGFRCPVSYPLEFVEEHLERELKPEWETDRMKVAYLFETLAVEYRKLMSDKLF